MTAAILVTMGLVPGMPHLAFLALGLLAGFAAWWMSSRRAQVSDEADALVDEAAADSEQLPASRRELSWDDVPVIHTLSLELGYRLVGLVDEKNGGDLLERIKGIRKNLSAQAGFLIPSVHIRDNLQLPATSYRIHLKGVALAESTLEITQGAGHHGSGLWPAGGLD